MFNMAGMDLPEYLKGKDKKTIESDDADIDTSGTQA
jgi:flotillin